GARAGWSAAGIGQRRRSAELGPAELRGAARVASGYRTAGAGQAASTARGRWPHPGIPGAGACAEVGRPTGRG
ncbi:MAG TPA: hypothetical protein VIY28_12070, partial [Pseudonocardiaceae bacterium]